MNILTAQTQAIEAMAANGLLKKGWSFRYDNAKRRHGATHHDKKLITLSRELTHLNSVEEVTQTIFHEIAHALVGPRHGHDRVWAAQCVKLGIVPHRLASSDAVRVEPKWVGTCPNGHKTLRMRRMQLACSKCCRKYNGGKYSVHYSFIWTANKKATASKAA